MKYLKRFNEDYENNDTCNIQSSGSSRRILPVNLEKSKPEKKVKYELTSGIFNMLLLDVDNQEEAEKQLKFWREKTNDPELRIKVIKNGKSSILWKI